MKPLALVRLVPLALLLAVSACGGGGGSSSDSGGGGTTPTTPITLSGIAAVGAPLGNAQVSVIDASGAAVGTATTHPSEGSYSITLSKLPTAPLLIQARGLDAAGNLQLLHSTVGTAATSMVAHITPLSDAIVGLSLGAEPRGQFATPTAASLANLSLAAGAQTFLKTLIKSQLTDLKVTDPTTLSLLTDSAFAANKGAHDLLIESLKLGYSRNSKGVDQLLISNKLLPTNTIEVQVDLPTAKTELAKTTTGTPATAIVSTLKATTSAATTLGNIGSLDDLGAALNKLIAQGGTAATMAADPLLSLYVSHDSRLAADLAAKLAGYASANRQLGRFLITGCADDQLASGDCKKVLVAAPVSDSTGTLVEFFADAVSYKATAATGMTKWSLVGNGRKRELALYPLYWLALEADGTASTSVTPNPSAGVQVLVQGQDLASPPAQLQTSATVQTPGGYSIPLAYCSRPYLCVSSTPGATSATATGGIADHALLASSLGWIGSMDALRGAKYQFSMTIGTTPETKAVYLRAEVPLEAPASARFPTLNGIGTSSPLLASAALSGLKVDWSNWLTANPDLRLISLRGVFSASGATTRIVEYTLPLVFKDPITLPVPPLLTATRMEYWLTAQDAQGRRFVTRYLAKF
ncbi:hypothetical protein J7U46_13300 [Pelomonas sp. V22]|uniref:hypothetical protein n=1 Tax=Pelomonas sp. V22 TaxID=2822139 RepID=UPI0024A83902|nr:hypothetical protein [Pelomonas sp. V22]MDI4634028.1 hypothetical protein [Pelomonas sp. V22]